MVNDVVAARVITKTTEEKPANGIAWSTRSLAQATGLSHSTILRIWNAYGIRPEGRKGRRFSIRKPGQIVPLNPNRKCRQQP